MQCSCDHTPIPPPGKPSCILAMQVLDSFNVQGQGERALLKCQFQPGCHVQFVSGSICGQPTLTDLRLESGRGRFGCCLNACLQVPYQLELMVNGCCEILNTVLMIPISGMFRNRCEAAMEYAAQVQIYGCQLCWCGRELELSFCYRATVYAACLRPLNVYAVPPDCQPSCEPFFGKPLYPQFR